MTSEVPLDELVATMQAGTRPAGGAQDIADGVPSLGGENVTRSGLLSTETLRFIPESYFRSMRRGVLQAGDVLVNKDGAQTGKVARYRGEFEQAAVNEHLFLLRAKPGTCDAGYLYWLLRAQRTQAQIARFVTGSAQPGLGQAFVRGVRVPVRSLPEQRHVAAVLDASQAGLVRSAEVIDKLRLLRVGLSESLFDGAEPSRTLSSLASAPIGYGIVQPGRHHTGGVELITIGDARRKLAGELFRVAPSLDRSYARSRVRGGDVIVSIKGTVGVVLVVPDGFSGNISRDVARIRLLRDLTPEYLSRYFESPLGQRLLEKSVVGTTRAEVSIGVLNRLEVPVPSRDEQARVVSVLSEADRRIASEEALLAKRKLLHEGLTDELIFGCGGRE